MNKKYLLVVSAIGTLAFFSILGFFQFGYCRSSEWCVGAVQDILSAAPGYLSIFVAALVITTLSFILKTEISKNFIFFSIAWITISVLVGQLFGQGSGGWVTTSPEPEGVFFVLTFLYLVIGILWHSMQFTRRLR